MVGTLSLGFGSFFIPFPHFRELPLEDRDFLPPSFFRRRPLCCHENTLGNFTLTSSQDLEPFDSERMSLYCLGEGNGFFFSHPGAQETSKSFHSLSLSCSEPFPFLISSQTAFSLMSWLLLAFPRCQVDATPEESLRAEATGAPS